MAGGLAYTVWNRAWQSSYLRQDCDTLPSLRILQNVSDSPGSGFSTFYLPLRPKPLRALMSISLAYVLQSRFRRKFNGVLPYDFDALLTVCAGRSSSCSPCLL